MKINQFGFAEWSNSIDFTYALTHFLYLNKNVALDEEEEEEEPLKAIRFHLDIMILKDIFLQNTTDHKCISFLERILFSFTPFASFQWFLQNVESKTFRFRLEEKELKKEKKKVKNGKEAHFRWNM